MGICSGKQKIKENNIQNQIKQAVQEQQEIEAEEEWNKISQHSNSFDEEEIHEQEQPQQQEEPPQEQSHEEIKQKEKKPKKKVREEHNYFRKQDYHIIINKFTQIYIKDDDPPHYNLTINISYQNFDYDIQMKGIIITNQNHFVLTPIDFEQANKFARFNTFFSQDQYFNAEPDQVNNSNYFDKLLFVERKIQVEAKSHHLTKKLSKRSSMAEDLASPMKKSPNKMKQQTVKELIEVVHIFDMEYSQRFHSILFQLLLQNRHPNLYNQLLFITDTIILYDSLPQLDSPKIYNICLFYPFLDYSLKDLLTHLDHEAMELSRISHMKLSVGLIKILVQCYQAYLYRLNITLTSVYYMRESKCFKLQSYGRIRSLIPFEDNQFIQLERKEAKDFKHFGNAFQKDYQNVSDLIILFKNTKGNNLKAIQKLRKKQKIDGIVEIDNSQYVSYMDQIFDAEQDKILLEFLKTGTQRLDVVDMQKQGNQMLDDAILQVEALEKQILEEEIQREKFQQAQLGIQQQPSPFSKSEDDEDDQEEQQEEIRVLDTFDFEFNTTRIKYSLSTQKFTDLQLKYKQMLYASLTMNNYLLEFCQSYLAEVTDTQHKVHAIIINSFAQTQSQEESLQRDMQIELLDQAVLLLQQNPSDHIDSFHFHLLFQLIILIPSRPYSLLVQLQRSIQKQHDLKVQLGSKLKGINEAKGIIEQRKFIILQLFYVQHFVKIHHFSQAVNLTQKIISMQLKNNLKNSMLYAYTIFENGLICERTLQYTSGMLNLEMSKQIYDQFFPQTIIKKQLISNNNNDKKQQEPEFVNVVEDINNLSTDNIATLELHLGIVYYQLHDQENALKCLRRAKQLRLGRFDEFADEILEITIQMLRIYVDQEETGQAVEICQQYAKRMDLYIKQKKPVKGKCVAKLQFIMAAIFQCSEVLLSALRYFTRANRSFTVIKANSYLRQMHIQAQIKAILVQVKERAFIANNMANEVQQNEMRQFKSISDAIKPYFNNQFFRKSNTNVEAISNPYVGSLFVSAHGFFKNQDSQIGFEKINKILNIFKKTKKDECYGLALEKLAIMYILQQKTTEGQQYLKFAIEVHERFLQFPQRELSIFRCNIYQLLAYGISKSMKLSIDQFEVIENIIADYHKLLKWNQMAEKVTFNKFVILSKKEGIKILYQIIDLELMIESYFQTKKKFISAFDNSQNMEKLKDVALSQANIFLGQMKGTKKWNEMRHSCLSGKSAAVSITQRRNAIQNPHLDGIRVLETVAIPQDTDHKKIQFRQQEQGEKPTVTKVMKNMLQNNYEQDIFGRQTQAPPKLLALDIRRPSEILEASVALEQNTKQTIKQKPQQPQQVKSQNDTRATLAGNELEKLQKQQQQQQQQQQSASQTPIELKKTVKVESQNMSFASSKQSKQANTTSMKKQTKINPFEKVSRKNV